MLSASFRNELQSYTKFSRFPAFPPRKHPLLAFRRLEEAVKRHIHQIGGGGLRRSTVAHFARKVRGRNIAVAKHGLNIQRGHGRSAGHVRHVFVALTLRAK